MDAFHCCQEAVGALDDVPVPLDTDEKPHLVRFLLQWTVFEGFGVDGDAGIGYTVSQQRPVSGIVLIQACHGAINSLKNVVAVLPHKRLFPVILMLRDVFSRIDVGRRLIAQHVVAVSVGMSVMASIIIGDIGSHRRQHDTAVVGLEVVKDLGDAVRLEPQENG